MNKLEMSMVEYLIALDEKLNKELNMYKAETLDFYKEKVKEECVLKSVTQKVVDELENENYHNMVEALYELKLVK